MTQFIDSLNTPRRFWVFAAVCILSSAAAAADTLNVTTFPADLQLNPLRTYTSTEAQFYSALHEGLVVPDPVSLKPLPGIAQKWEHTDSQLTFHLRENARFSDGRTVTAQDFRATFLAHLDPGNPSPFSSFLDPVAGAKEYRTANGAARDVGIHAETPHTLVFELDQPGPFLLDMLTHQSMSVIHPDQLDVDDWDTLSQIQGTGPFVIDTHSDTEMILVPNEYYWDRGRITLDTIHIIFSDDTAEVTRQFNQGELQWADGNFDFSMVNNRDYILANPLFSTSFLFFNHRQPAFRQPEIRTALSLLVPWQDIRSEDELYLPTNQLVPEIPGYSSVEGITVADNKTALQLLESAGHPNGQGLPAIVIRIPTVSAQRRLAERIQAAITDQLETRVEIEQFERGDNYFDSLDQENYTIGSLTWIGDYLDPLTFLMLFESDSGLNESGYSSERFDELISRSHLQTGSDRMQTLAEAERLLLSEGTVWPISHTVAFHLVNTQELEGWFPTALDIHPYTFMRRIKFTPGPGITLPH